MIKGLSLLAHIFPNVVLFNLILQGIPLAFLNVTSKVRTGNFQNNT